jgi:hypothetical protein
MNDFAVARTGARAKGIFRLKDQNLLASQGHGSGNSQANNTRAYDDSFYGVHLPSKLSCE